MKQQNRGVELHLELAEGPRPEQEEDYERAERDLTRRPLEEPVEGAPKDVVGEAG